MKPRARSLIALTAVVAQSALLVAACSKQPVIAPAESQTAKAEPAASSIGGPIHADAGVASSAAEPAPTPPVPALASASSPAAKEGSRDGDASATRGTLTEPGEPSVRLDHAYALLKQGDFSEREHLFVYAANGPLDEEVLREETPYFYDEDAAGKRKTRWIEVELNHDLRVLSCAIHGAKGMRSMSGGDVVKFVPSHHDERKEISAAMHQKDEASEFEISFTAPINLPEKEVLAPPSSPPAKAGLAYLAALSRDDQRALEPVVTPEAWADLSTGWAGRFLTESVGQTRSLVHRLGKMRVAKVALHGTDAATVILRPLTEPKGTTVELTVRAVKTDLGWRVRYRNSLGQVF